MPPLCKRKQLFYNILTFALLSIAHRRALNYNDTSISYNYNSAGGVLGDIILAILYFLALTAIITAIYGSLQREANHSLYVILLSLVITFFALGSLLVLGSNSAETAFMGFRIQHIGLPFVGALWFSYTMDVCGNGIKKKSAVILLMALPVIISLGVTAGDPLRLFIHSLSYCRGGVLPYVTGNFTLLYCVGLLHVYVFNFASSILIIRKMLKHSSEQSKPRLFVHLCAGMLPFLVGIIMVVFDLPYKREAVSAVLCISSIMLNMYLFKTGVFRIVTKAKYQLFESIQDGIVIVNNRNEYMDSNDMAKQIFPILAEAESGASIWGMEGISPILSNLTGNGGKFTSASAPKHYRLTRSELLEDHRYIGSTFMIYDITELEELNMKLIELATTDELTQVNNRRNFFSLAEGMVDTMARLKTEVCVAMLDIDDFKKVNDAYGHLFGDEVLKALAARCKALLRHSDILGRYGGEEFAIVLYGMDPDSTKRRLEHIRQSLSEMEIRQGDIKTNITVSIGCAPVNYETGRPLHDAILQADIALYKAKHDGKNKVCCV